MDHSWRRRNNQWKIEDATGRRALRQKHAEFKFGSQDFRFTVGKNGALYAFCMTVPKPGEQLKIKSLGTNANALAKPVRSVKLLGFDGNLKWIQEADGIVVSCPSSMPFATSIVFKID